MSFWFSVLLFVGFTILGELLRPKPKFDTPQPSSLGDFQLPTAEEGRAIPVVWGTCHVKGPNVLWYGGLSIQPITKRVKTGLFSKTTVTTGYKYFLTVHVGICHGAIGTSGSLGQIDESTFQVAFDERIPFQSLATSGTEHSNARMRGFGQTVTISDATRFEKYQCTVNAPGMFGGDEKEGGISGVIDVYTGGLWNSANDQLETLLGQDLPAYRGISHAVLRGMYVGTSAYIKPISFMVTRCASPKRFIDGDTTIDANADIQGDANPAYMLLEILTDNIWGLGIPVGLIDKQSFYDVAETLKDEGLGLSMMLDNPAEARGVISDILRHIDGVIYTDPSTGLITITLAREDYDPDTLPVFDQSNLRSVEMTRGSWSETKNVVKILYIDAGRTQPDVDESVLLQCEFDEDNEADISIYEMTPSLVGSAQVSGEQLLIPWVDGGIGEQAHLAYTGGAINNHNGDDFTLEFQLTIPAGAAGTSDRRLTLIQGTSGDSRLFLVHNSGSGDYRKIYHRTSDPLSAVMSSAQIPIGVRTHVAMVTDIANVRLNVYFAGVEVINTATGVPVLPVSNGVVTLGSNASGAVTGDIIIDDVRLSVGRRYTAAFTPPAHGSLRNPIETGDITTARFVERPVQWQNLANIESRGGKLAAEVIKFHGFSKAENANKAAARVGKTLSYPLAAIHMVSNRDAWQLRPGSVFKLNWPPLGITGMVCRVGEIRYGDLLKNRIDIDAVEDIFGLAETAYSAPPATTWSDPVVDVEAPDAEALIELPYHFIGADERYVATLAMRSSGLDLGYEVWSDRDGDSTLDAILTNTVQQFAPSGVLTAEYEKCTDALDATGFSVQNGRDLNLLESINAAQRDAGVNIALIRSVNGDEFVGWQTVAGNSGGSTATITNVVRGVLDTVPLTHPAGSRVWFFTEGFGIADETEYPEDITVLAKLLPFNGKGTLDIADAAELECVLDSRALKPYPPGNVKVNGESCPVVIDTDVIFTWAHRHRVTQTADQVIVHQDAGDYVAEPEGDYRVEIEIEGEIVQTFEDFALSSDGYQVEYTMAQRELDNTNSSAPVTFRIIPINDDGLEGTPREVTFVMGDSLLLNDESFALLNDGEPILLNG
jgi:hypothetical protein